MVAPPTVNKSRKNGSVKPAPQSPAHVKPAVTQVAEFDVNHTGNYLPNYTNPTLLSQPHAAPAHRSSFYTGYDRKSLQVQAIRRVRELEEMNDVLQREIHILEEECQNTPEDLAKLLADLEYRKSILARNTGEIMKIFREDSERIFRIHELQEMNIRLQKEIEEGQELWNKKCDLDTRIRISSEMLYNQELISKNLQEIAELKRP